MLTAVCKRPHAEVGKLLKAVVTYVNEGTHTGFDSQYLEAYYDLLVIDIDAQRSAAGEKSRKCSENAKCRTARKSSKPSAGTRMAPAESSQGSANAAPEPFDAIVQEGMSGADAEDDVASQFEQLKLVYGKTGSNGLQAFGVWQQLTVAERTAAFTHAQQMQDDYDSRPYLYVYLRDKEWENEMTL